MWIDNQLSLSNMLLSRYLLVDPTCEVEVLLRLTIIGGKIRSHTTIKSERKRIFTLSLYCYITLHNHI